MESNIRLYSLNYNEVRTYGVSALFVLANLLLPQLCHLLPQGGVILAPLSLVMLVGAYKFGWKAAVLAAVVSPLVNHLLTGMPAWGILPVMTVKLMILALVAGLVAQRMKKVTVLLLMAVVLGAEMLGGMAEFLLTGGIAMTVADFVIGWPGLLLQVVGGFVLLKLKL